MTFVPVVYEHAAALIGRRPFEVSRDAGLLAAAHAVAYARYHHSPVVVGIDVYNVEVEAYGATLRDAGGSSIPSIEAPFCHCVNDIFALKGLDPLNDGRFPLVLAAASTLRATCPGAAIAIPVSGPFSIVQGLMGMEELLYATMADPDNAREALLVVARHLLHVIEVIASRGFDVILFESSASPPLLSPVLFRRVEAPALALIGQEFRRKKKKGLPMILGGNTLPVLEDILRAGAGGVICPAEVDGTSFMNVMERYPEVEVRVNMRPGVFAASFDEAEREAAKAMDVARGRPNACIGSGVLPYDAKPEIVLHIHTFIEECLR
jgi:hypothetical protein